MSLTRCLAVADGLTDADRDDLLGRVDAMRAAGLDAAEAQRQAAQDMLAEALAEIGALKLEVARQHPELFDERKPELFGRSAPEAPEADGAPPARPQLARAPDTEAFKRWFGDSKVVDAEGRPLVVYHGTPSDIESFRGKEEYWFTADPSVASSYAKTEGGNLIPSYLAIHNPLMVDAKGKPFHRIPASSLPRSFDVVERTSSDVVAMLAKDAGYDGVIFRNMADESIEGQGRPSDVFAVFKSAQIKSAIGNAGTFDPRSADIRLARAPAGRPGQFELPEFGAGSQMIEAIQNRYNRWKQTLEAVRSQGGVVTEANDFYSTEERYWGKVGSRMEDFDRDVQQFVKDVKADGLTLHDVQVYAYARHAKERNAHLRQLRAAGTGGFDSWSGMSDADADAYLMDAQLAGLQPQLERHQQTLQKWIQGTRDLMLDEGLINQTQYFELSGMFSDYVPLRGREGKPERRGTGQGFSTRGKETQRARGRYSEADNIIEQIIQDRSRTLIRAGKNEVMRSFLQFVLDNPSDNLWEVNAVETKPVMTVDAQGNQVIEEQTSIVKDQRTVGIKDGGREVSILIKDEKLLEQMRNMHIENVSALVGLMLTAQRALGKLYTSLNPVFTVLNWARDVQAATMGMLDSVGAAGALRLWKDIPRAIGSAYAAEFGKPSADYQLFRASGGKTGFFDFKDIDTLSKDLQRRIDNAGRSAIDPRVWAPGALELVEKLNAGIENGTRFASFLAARESGKSVAEAASISKNITVNFNRKGTWTPSLSAFFLFFNPAVQGTARIAQSLRSPLVLATLGAGMTGVAMLALQNASMGDDDDGIAWWDKIPAETKDRNLIIVLPPTSTAGEPVPGSKTGRFLKIPMPYGWNFFATVANQAVDFWRHRQDPARGRGAGEAAMKTVTSLIGAYMPVQELGRSLETPKSAVLAAVPDFLNPVAQPLMNVNAFGRPMYPEDSFGKQTPDASKFFVGQAGTLFQRAAEELNEISGGNKYASGVLDFTPATIENIVRSYGGGPASFALDIANAMYARQSIERPDLDVRRLPFVKQLYGQIDAETDRQAGFERMDKIESAVEPIKAARKDRHPEIARALANEAGPIAELGGALKTTRAQMSTIRKQELQVINSERTDTEKYLQLRELDERKRKAFQQLNRAYVGAMRRPTGALPEPD